MDHVSLCNNAVVYLNGLKIPVFGQHEHYVNTLKS